MRVIVGDPAPIAGAEVFLDEVSVGLTGADGSLAIAEVTEGSHTIHAHKEWTDTFYAMVWAYDGQVIRFGLRTTY